MTGRTMAAIVEDLLAGRETAVRKCDFHQV